MTRPSLPVRITTLALPVLILTQFLLAGLALFPGGTGWSAHGGLGALLLAPILVLFLARPLRGWALLLALLYGLQIALIVLGQDSGSVMLMALHPFNAGLLLAAALMVAMKATGST